MFKVWGGSIIGSEHQFRQANRQDSYRVASINHGDIFIQLGVLCDGCGEGFYSEVGANLTAQFIVQQIPTLLEQNICLPELPTHLFQSYCQWGQSLLRLFPGITPTEMIQNYLLTTLLGFVIMPETTLIFHAGDGAIVVNDQIYRLEQNNRPVYPAYALLGAKVGFDTMTLPTKELENLALFSDGFEPEWLPELPLPGGERLLQRTLNLWSKQKRFSDDATAIVVKRVTPCE